MREALGEAALLIYLRDGPALRALVVAGGSASLVTLGGFSAAADAVLRLRADLDARAGRALPHRLAEAVAAATARDARMVSAAVLDPLLGLVGDRDLVVVPTGILITVPWSALPGCAGRPVTVTPSATTWLTASRRLAAGRLGPRAAALLVAGPGTSAAPAKYGRSPPCAAGEHAPGRGCHVGRPRAALGAVTIAHLAAHGRHQAENALFSTLELADGPLLGYDLQQLPRTPAMVVLSCCDLGLTDTRPGDETLGMVTALLSTGSATVIANVARVADDTAADTMISSTGPSPPGSARRRPSPRLSRTPPASSALAPAAPRRSENGRAPAPSPLPPPQLRGFHGGITQAAALAAADPARTLPALANALGITFWVAIALPQSPARCGRRPVR